MNCPHCGRTLPGSEGQHFCQFCGGRLDVYTEPSVEEFREGRSEEIPENKSTEDDSIRPRDGYCPWEDQERLGLFVGLFRTVKETLFTPEAFFTMMPIHKGFLSPLLYALIVGTIGAMAGTLWGFAFENSILSEAAKPANLTVFAGVLIPVLVFFGIMVSALLLHIALMVIGAANEDFEATFRVACYTSSTDLFSVVPVVGTWVVLVSLAWKLYITLVGLRAVHRISATKAAIAIILPVLVLCGLIVVVLVAWRLPLGIGGE